MWKQTGNIFYFLRDSRVSPLRTTAYKNIKQFRHRCWPPPRKEFPLNVFTSSLLLIKTRIVPFFSRLLCVPGCCLSHMQPLARRLNSVDTFMEQGLSTEQVKSVFVLGREWTFDYFVTKTTQEDVFLLFLRTPPPFFLTSAGNN